MREEDIDSMSVCTTWDNDPVTLEPVGSCILLSTQPTLPKELMFRFVKLLIQPDSMDMLNLSGTQGRTSRRIDELITLDCFPRNQLISPWLGIYLHNFQFAQELSYQSQLFICHKQPATQEVPNDSQAKEVGIGPQWQLQAIGSDMVTSVEELRCLSCLEITPPPKKKHVLGGPRFQG